MQMQWDSIIDPDMDAYHAIMTILSRDLKFKYERKKSQ